MKTWSTRFAEGKEAPFLFLIPVRRSAARVKLGFSAFDEQASGCVCHGQHTGVGAIRLQIAVDSCVDSSFPEGHMQ